MDKFEKNVKGDYKMKRIGKYRKEISKIIESLMVGIKYPPELIRQANCTMNNRYATIDTQYYWVAYPENTGGFVYGMETMIMCLNFKP